MEVFATKREYLIVAGEHALHACRKSGKLSTKNASFLLGLHDPKCLGVVFGVVGRLSMKNNTENYLLLVKQAKNVGSYPLNQKFVYRIQQVIALPLTLDEIAADVSLEACKKHSSNRSFVKSNAEPLKRADINLNFLQKQQKKVAKATADSLKFVSNQVQLRSPTSTTNGLANVKMLDEVLKLFNENCSFYFSDADLTNNLQRSVDGAPYDERFFWNKALLADIFASDDEQEKKFWLKPVVQGFVETHSMDVELSCVDNAPSSSVPCDFTLISRRSVSRAGTRYIKRGVDEQGNCANFVETEQIVNVCGHLLSFVQVRASIPLFWSQPGFKYKPPPRIERSKPENVAAFRRHFLDISTIYGELLAVNLVDQTGKEKTLSDAYFEHALEDLVDCGDVRLTYVAFDFHEYCRGLKFENVAVLVEALADAFSIMKFCWLDKKREFICRQLATFRVNCVDCLDRTNVVQAAFGKVVLEHQFRKLGLLSPDDQLAKKWQQVFQAAWANNGDMLSRQYAGTAALKGDFTRTGQRNLAGMVKDGYNSASRYYLCHVKDARRQAAIDAVLGNVDVVDVESVVRRSMEDERDTWLTQKDENLRLLVLDCQKLVLPANETQLAGWALIDADATTGDETEDDMDTVVLLTRDAYYVADYDEQLDKFVDVQRVALAAIDSVEVGPMTVSTFFGVSRAKSVCIRVNYRLNGTERGYFHVWRSGGTRLFNNLAIAIKSPEDADEYVRAIGEQFNVALQVCGVSVPFVSAAKLERKKSKMPPSKFGGDRKHFGFISNVLSPLASAAGNVMKLSGKNLTTSSASDKYEFRGRSTSEVAANEATAVVEAKEIIGRKWRGVDFVHFNCGVLFSSIGELDEESQSKLANASPPRRFSVPFIVGGTSSALNDDGDDLTGNSNFKLGTSEADVQIEISPPILTLNDQDNVSTNLGNELFNLSNELKMSHSESSLKGMESLERRVEKSSSSSAMSEKLADGRRFFQNLGQQVQGGAQKTLAAAVGAKKTPKSSIYWQQFEGRIKKSSTKFILL